MNRSLSVYFDLVRISAAMLVFISHTNRRSISEAVIPASTYGHSSVIVFFVLSGFVIAYVTATKEKTWVDYASARLSRVLSVAVPTVLLTIVLDAIGRHLAVEHYNSPFDHIVLRAATSLAMLNETWFVSITSFSNVPYWSICYESWYYVMFGVAAFAPRRHATALVLLLALVIGPKVILLAPLWVAGVVLFRWRALQALSRTSSWMLVVASIAGIVAFHRYGVTELTGAWLERQIGADAYRELTWSKNFASDYLLGLLVCMNFAGMRRVADDLAGLILFFERPIRFAAAYTFTLYLLHQPLIVFWAAVIGGDPRGMGYWFAVVAASLGSILLVGYVTENKRHLLTAWILSRLGALRETALRRSQLQG